MNEYNAYSGQINHIINTHIFISDCWGASDLNQLEKFKIKHVINIGAQIKEHPNIKYYHYAVLDNLEEDLLKNFNEVFAILDNLYSNKQYVLVNCQAGVSRSASFIIGYLIKNGLNYENSYQCVKNCRQIINPNKGFIEQLKKYELSLQKENNNIN